MAIRTVVLDAGHGGKDSGAVGNGLQEKNIVLQIVNYAKDYLEDNYNEVSVKLTRSSDVFVELTDRAKFANGLKATCFCSVHINAATSAAAQGMEVYIFNGTTSAATKNLQLKVHDEIMKRAPYFKDRGMPTANFSVLRNSAMPSILTETGFISNGDDAAVLKDKAKLQKIGEAIAIGIATAFGFGKKPVKPPTTSTQYNYKVVADTLDNKKDAEALQSSLVKLGYKNVSIVQEKA